jgi:hypothetical protein
MRRITIARNLPIEIRCNRTSQSLEQTAVAPFIPQSQGVRNADFADAVFIPRGNAIPINNPIGKSINTATRMRSVVAESWNVLIAYGASFPKITVHI